MRLNELTSPQLAALRGRRPVALWPVGAVEPHGPHAPLGTDTLISVGISEATLRAVVLDVAAAVAAQGFRRLAIVNNHFEPEQLATLRAAAQEAGALYLDLVRRANAERLTDEFRRGSGHAGRYETSLMLADAPQLVDREAMAGLPAVEVDMPAEIAAGRTDFLAMGMEQAYCGAPAEATAEEGEATFETLTDMLVQLVRE